jgi:hypothetical protein
MTWVLRITYKESQCAYYELGSMVSDAFLNFFIVFHQVYSPSPHSYFLHFTWLNCFLILLQHMNQPHFNCVLLRSVLAVCQVVCSHSIMRLIHHPSHTVHYWVLSLAQYLIGISVFLEPSVSVWLISNTLWKSPSHSYPFWNVPNTWPCDI